MLLAYLLLVIPFLVLGLAGQILNKPALGVLGGVLGTSVCFFAFGVMHFTADDIVVQMLPPWLPGRLGIVYLTGVIEILLAVLILVPRFRVQAGWACIFLLFAFFPANIYTHMADVPVPGHGSLTEFLLVRTTFQISMIVWTWWFAVRS